MRLPDDLLQSAITAFAEISPPRLRHLVGVSGGRDSVALLDLLHLAGYRNLVVCHLNHSLRGRESGQDATFVRRLAARYGVAFESEKVDVARLSADENLSLEDAGRRARHAFFARASKKWRCRRVVLGHHADDQIETVLMNLGRGTGGGGLGGMRTKSEIFVPPKGGSDSRICLLRPLLSVRRDLLRIHLETRTLPHREDRSNTDPAHLRNRVRHRLVPALAEIFGRDPGPPILRAASINSDEDAFLGALAADAYSDSVVAPPVPGLTGTNPLSPILAIRHLRVLHTSIQRRVLHLWLTELGIPDFGFREIEAVRALVQPGADTAKTNLPRDHHARRKSGRLFVTASR